MFCYQETKVEVDGGITKQNMSFIFPNTMWQKEMMIKHGCQKGVAIDITFGTNEKKVIHIV
jgi:hypothetical protein